MHVYFVRHGETDLNRRNVHQSPGTPLNLRGFDQARSIAEYLRPMNPTLLLTSTHVRALQTARVIGFATGVEPKPNQLFREVDRPTILTERSFYAPRTFMYVLLSTLFRNNPKWRYKDAENFSDIYARVQKTLPYIESFTEAHESIVIVSHSEYINLMIAYMCHDKKLSLREIVTTFLKINELRNCDVVHVEYVGPTRRGTCAWLLRE